MGLVLFAHGPLRSLHLMGGRSGILGRLTIISINMVKVTLPFFCCLLQLNIHVACIERPHPLLGHWVNPYLLTILSCRLISNPVVSLMLRGPPKLLGPPMASTIIASMHLATLDTSTELR